MWSGSAAKRLTFAIGTVAYLSSVSVSLAEVQYHTLVDNELVAIKAAVAEHYHQPKHLDFGDIYAVEEGEQIFVCGFANAIYSKDRALGMLPFTASIEVKSGKVVPKSFTDAGPSEAEVMKECQLHLGLEGTP